MERYFEVQGKKGILRGLCHIPESGISQKAPVIMIHGYFSATKIGAARLHVLLARKIAVLGFPVYRFDFYGTGDSDGDYEEIRFALEMDDLYRVAEYVQQQNPGKRPILIGHSLGANLALYASGVLKSPVVVAISSIPSRKGIDVYFDPNMLRQLDHEGYTYRKGFYITNEFIAAVRNELYRTANPDAKIALVHGLKDEFVPLAWPTELNKILNGSSVIFVENGDHNFFQPESRQELLRLVPSLLLNLSV